MNVKLTAAQKIKIANSQDIFSVMQQILLRQNKLRRAQEHFWVVGLNNANSILFIELVSLGAANRVAVAPPELFRMGIYKLATKVILVHNHPSGQMAASEADKTFTGNMLKAGEIIQIEVLDHLIISETTYLSFEDKGLMQQLRQRETRSELNRYRQELKELKLEIEKEKAEKKGKLDVAKKMLADKQPIDTIRKYTGLTKKEVEGLMKVSGKKGK